MNEEIAAKTCMRTCVHVHAQLQTQSDPILYADAHGAEMAMPEVVMGAIGGGSEVRGASEPSQAVPNLCNIFIVGDYANHGTQSSVLNCEKQ